MDQPEETKNQGAPKMNALEQLSSFLEPEYEINLWSDNAVILAEEMVSKLSSRDWINLSDIWLAQKLTWQRRLADALSEGPAQHALPILRRMLLSHDDELALVAAGSIRSLLLVGNPGSLNPEEVLRLKGLSKLSPLYQMVFAEMIKKFDAAI